MACMSGAAISTMTDGVIKPNTRLALAFGTGALALSTAASSSGNLKLSFASFLVFEFCVGVYFPSIGILKSEVVPEHVRGTMYNIYRVPLNAVVVGLLLSHISMLQCFLLCATLLSVALLSVLGVT